MPLITYREALIEAVAVGRIKASPLAKEIAAEMGVDLDTLQGSGPGDALFGRMLSRPGNLRPRSKWSSRDRLR